MCAFLCLPLPYSALHSHPRSLPPLDISAMTHTCCHALQCYARLVGGHKLGVTKLLVIGGKDTTSPDRLVSAGADGTVALWDPSAAARGAAAKEVSPVSTAKVHDSEILSLALCCAPTAGAEPGPVMLATSGQHIPVVA